MCVGGSYNYSSYQYDKCNFSVRMSNVGSFQGDDIVAPTRLVSSKVVAVGLVTRGGRVLANPVPESGEAEAERIGKISKFLQIFGGLVLGCTKTKFCKKICV